MLAYERRKPDRAVRYSGKARTPLFVGCTCNSRTGERSLFLGNYEERGEVALTDENC